MKYAIISNMTINVTALVPQAHRMTFRPHCSTDRAVTLDTRVTSHEIVFGITVDKENNIDIIVKAVRIGD